MVKGCRGGHDGKGGWVLWRTGPMVKETDGGW